MTITVNESDTNDILQTVRYICNALMMITRVIETFAICHFYRFH